MSIVTTFSVFCDGMVAAEGPAKGKPCCEWETRTTAGAAAARSMAKVLGWTRKGAEDFCPACSQEMAEAATPDRAGRVGVNASSSERGGPDVGK